jgi:hypothetical protein
MAALRRPVVQSPDKMLRYGPHCNRDRRGWQRLNAPSRTALHKPTRIRAITYRRAIVHIDDTLAAHYTSVKRSPCQAPATGWSVSWYFKRPSFSYRGALYHARLGGYTTLPDPTSIPPVDPPGVGVNIADVMLLYRCVELTSDATHNT